MTAVVAALCGLQACNSESSRHAPSVDKTARGGALRSDSSGVVQRAYRLFFEAYEAQDQAAMSQLVGKAPQTFKPWIQELRELTAKDPGPPIRFTPNWTNGKSLTAQGLREVAEAAERYLPTLSNEESRNLEQLIQKDALSSLGLSSIQKTDAPAITIQTKDGIQTWIHRFDSSVTVVPEAIATAYDFYSSENLKNMLTNLKQGRRAGVDFFEHPEDPTMVFFLHEFSKEFQPIGVMMVRTQAYRQRHILVLPVSATAPPWMGGSISSTRTHGDVAVSIVRAEQGSSASRSRTLSAACLREIFYQTIRVASPLKEGGFAPSGSPVDIMAQEVTAQGFASSALLRRLGYNWSTASEQTAEPQRLLVPQGPENGVSKAKVFQLTSAVFESLPKDGLLLR